MTNKELQAILTQYPDDICILGVRLEKERARNFVFGTNNTSVGSVGGKVVELWLGDFGDEQVWIE